MNFFNPTVDEIFYLVTCADVISEGNYFHWFVYKRVFNIEFINATNNKEDIFEVIPRYGEYKCSNPVSWM